MQAQTTSSFDISSVLKQFLSCQNACTFAFSPLNRGFLFHCCWLVYSIFIFIIFRTIEKQLGLFPILLQAHLPEGLYFTRSFGGKRVGISHFKCNKRGINLTCSILLTLSFQPNFHDCDYATNATGS